MPILDVELVGAPPADDRPGLASRLADAASTAIGAPPARTWVRVRSLPRERYGEGGGALPESVRPVFVTVLKAAVPEEAALAAEAKSLAEAVAQCCERPVENVHVLYLPPAAGRMAFGGELVRA